MISGLILVRQSLHSLATEFAERPVSKCTLTSFPTFKVDLPRTVCGSVCLSVENMTPFANTFDTFFPFDIVEYIAQLSNTSTRFSCPVSTVSARNAWDHDLKK